MARVFEFKNAGPTVGPDKVHAAATAVRSAKGGHRFVGKTVVWGVLYLSAGLFTLSAFIGALAR